jgi:hypothetical protein
MWYELSDFYLTLIRVKFIGMTHQEIDPPAVTLVHHVPYYPTAIELARPFHPDHVAKSQGATPTTEQVLTDGAPAQLGYAVTNNARAVGRFQRIAVALTGYRVINGGP